MSRKTVNFKSGQILLNIRMNLSSKQVIQHRQTYGILDFLGDSGGLYESVFLIGAFLHFLVSSDTLSIKMLDRHFKFSYTNGVQTSRLSRKLF